MRKLTIEETVTLETEHGFGLEVDLKYDVERVEPVAVDVGFGQNLAVEPGYETVTITHAWIQGYFMDGLIDKIQKAVDDGYLELG